MEKVCFSDRMWRKERKKMTESRTAKIGEELVAGTPAGESKSWNWHPDIPIQYSPLFSFPVKPIEVLKWFVSAWLPVTELGGYLLIATVVTLWVQPPLQETTTLGAD